MSQQNQSSNQIFIGYRVQLIGISVLVIALIFIASYAAFYFYTLQVARDAIQTDMSQTLLSAITGVDAESFAEFSVEGTDGDLAEAYQQHLDWLETVQQLENRAVVYTYIVGDSEATLETFFIGDGYQYLENEEQAQYAAGYLEQYEPDVEDPASFIFYGGLSELNINMEGYSDDWGQWVSAYAPIRNSEGSIVGAMGIDFQASYVREVTQPILTAAIYAVIATLVASVIVFALLSYRMTRRIKIVTESAGQIGEGNYDQDMSQLQSGWFSDEITVLARVFEIMTEKVAHREARLKQEVADLKITIDQQKRDEEVGDIVESEFFQSLKARVATLREQREEAK